MIGARLICTGWNKLHVQWFKWCLLVIVTRTEKQERWSRWPPCRAARIRKLRPTRRTRPTVRGTRIRTETTIDAKAEGALISSVFLYFVLFRFVRNSILGVVSCVFLSTVYYSFLYVSFLFTQSLFLLLHIIASVLFPFSSCQGAPYIAFFFWDCPWKPKSKREYFTRA